MTRYFETAICIPAFNNVNYIKRLLSSVFKQNYSNYIIIVTDDSSDNNVEEYIRSICDPRVIYFRNEIRLGATNNNNEAIKHSLKYHPKYIKIMHHDDEFTRKDSLQIMVKALNENPDHIFCVCSCNIIYDNKVLIHDVSDKIIQSICKNPYFLFFNNVLGSPSDVLIRNQEDNRLFDDNLTWNVDWELYLRMLLESPKMVYIHDVLVNNHTSTEQLTNSCITDPRLRIYEACYLYNKYLKMTSTDHILNQALKEIINSIKFINNSKELDKILLDAGDSSFFQPILNNMLGIVKKKLLICGNGKAFHNRIHGFIRINSIIVGVADKKIDRIYKDNYFTYFPYKEVANYEYDYILITPRKLYASIKQYLIGELGIDEKKILPEYAIDFVQFLRLDR